MAPRGARLRASVMSVARVALCGLAAGAVAPRAAALPPDAARIDAGRVVYRQQCAACHGAQGQGAPAWEQPDAQGEMPAPPHNARGHTWKHSDAMLYRLVQDGWHDPFNKTDRMTMPAFKGQLSRGDTIAVIEYLKTLWTPEQQRFQAEESRGHPYPPEAP